LVGYDNECASCGLQYGSYTLPEDSYGVILFTTAAGEAATISMDDPVWGEVEELVSLAARKNHLRDFHEPDIFSRVLVQTIDTPDQSPLFVWGRIPCPRCSSRRRAEFGPSQPPQLKDVDPRPIQHERWKALSHEEKRRLVDDVIEGWLAER
jgi:hypothetical protein